MSSVSVTIIIPAHNEDAVISKTLDRLLSSDLSNQFEVIVVCNACTDRTVEVAKHFLPVVTVLETDVPSKTNALNLGDARSTGDIRVYMDADVLLSGDDVQILVDQLNNRRLMAVSPNIKMDLQGASIFVRVYYSIWLSLPYVKEGFMGGGVYVLSKGGREKFEIFPDVISDDGYIQAMYGKGEAARIDEVFSVVKAPRTLLGLIKIKTRSRLGGYQLLLKFPELRQTHRKDYRSALFPFLKQPTKWPAFIVYLFINSICRIRARYHMSQIENYVWETDTTSRVESHIEKKSK